MDMEDARKRIMAKFINIELLVLQILAHVLQLSHPKWFILIIF